MAGNFENVLNLPQRERIVVEVNAVGIAFWPPETSVKYLATGYLNACTAVIIISPRAGILAHIAPVPLGSTSESLSRNPNAARQNAQTLLRVVAQHYNTNRAKFEPSQTYVVAGIFNNSPATPEVVRLVNQFFSQLGLQVIWKSYDVLGAGVARPTGRTSIVIHAAAQGVMPVVYVNGSPIR